MADPAVCVLLVELLRPELDARFDALRSALLTRIDEATANGPANKRAEVQTLPKRACCADYDHMLEHDELLQTVFSYIGREQHLYVALVSRRWRGLYYAYCK
jgi:hypothetical protein